MLQGFACLGCYVAHVVSSQLKCDGTRAETRFLLSAKRTSPFKSAGSSIQSTTSSRGVRISGSNAGYTMFQCSVKGNGYPLHSPVSPSLSLPYVTVCHHISTRVYLVTFMKLKNIKCRNQSLTPVVSAVFAYLLKASSI